MDIFVPAFSKRNQRLEVHFFQVILVHIPESETTSTTNRSTTDSLQMMLLSRVAICLARLEIFENASCYSQNDQRTFTDAKSVFQPRTCVCVNFCNIQSPMQPAKNSRSQCPWQRKCLMFYFVPSLFLKKKKLISTHLLRTEFQRAICWSQALE